MKYPMGSVSHGTMNPEHLIPRFVSELERLDKEHGRDHSALIAEAKQLGDGDFNSYPDLFDALDSFAGPYFYFGSHPGDGADYGFWLYEDWEQYAANDGAVFVADLAEIPDDAEGEYVVVSDHGNASLYNVTQGVASEVWSVV